jgi:hypothetical protein
MSKGAKSVSKGFPYLRKLYTIDLEAIIGVILRCVDKLLDSDGHQGLLLTIALRALNSY